MRCEGRGAWHSLLTAHSSPLTSLTLALARTLPLARTLALTVALALALALTLTLTLIS